MSKLFFPILDNGMGLSRTSWAMSLAQASLTVLRDYGVTLRGLSYPYPDGAANIAANEFLQSDCDEMVLIDTDVIFTPNHLRWLLSHDEPLVFGLYPKKVRGLHFPCEWLDETICPFAADAHADGVNPLVEVRRTARGFMRAHRYVFEKLKGVSWKVPNFHGEGEIYEFWKNLPGGHSDDFRFCDQWRAIGGRILIDQRITAQHEGSIVFPIPGTF